MFKLFPKKSDYQLLMEEFRNRYESVGAERRNFLNLAMIERTMPTLRAFAVETGRDVSLWEGAVETLWKVAKGSVECPDINALTKECFDAVPEDGETDSELETFAQNAVISIYDALAHLGDSDPRHSALISSNMYDCVDGYAQFDLLDTENSADEITGEDEAEIANHPIVKQEVQRQLDDLKRLQEISEFNDNIIRQLCSDWRTDSRQMFVLEDLKESAL